MDQLFTEAEKQFMRENIPRYIDELTAQVLQLIAQKEAEANADFARQGITFEAHSAANADYLAVCVMEN